MRRGGAKGRAGRGPRAAAMAAAVTEWFRANRRELPWREVDRRTGRRDPYRSLVSEFMLQQTQVSRVIERFGRFIERFPDVGALAAANEEDVLAAWAGLGYYRRARLLHAAAREIVARFGGRVPEDVEDLRTLPGVGRYTAGAMASMVFGRAEPLVDGNVVRVVLRVEGWEGAADDRGAVGAVWARAEELVRASESPGEFNEGLMEVGATVCGPGAARCGECPLARMCVARRLGVQGSIPRAKKAAVRRRVVHWCALVRDGRGRVLLERAPAGALWAGLWRLPTWEGSRVTGAELGARLGVGALEFAGEVKRQLSHRTVRLRLFRGTSGVRAVTGRKWVRVTDLERVGVSNAHLAAIALAMTAGGSDGKTD